MTRTTIAMLAAMLLALPARADHPAVGYWFVEVAKLTNAVNRVGALAKVDQSVLDDLAECRGTFKGSCDLWLLAPHALQVRLKTTDDSTNIVYSIQLSWPQVKRQPQGSEGKLSVGSEPTAKDGWGTERFALVLKRLNLKQ